MKPPLSARGNVCAMADKVDTAAVDVPTQRKRAPSALQKLAELEVATQDFDDPGLEWRRLFSELLGTFMLVLAGAGGAVVNAKSGGGIRRTGAGAAPALTGLGVILLLGAHSRAHLHPAVTVRVAAR